jgi:GNAT superfamily N-acetyltransferase
VDPSPVVLVEATPELLVQCLAFDHLAANGSAERRSELTDALDQRRMTVATAAGRAVGYSVTASWFFGVAFLELLYVAEEARRHGVGGELLADFEERRDRPAFTSTNQSNARMQRLLRSRGWQPCGMLHGLDAGDPELFFAAPPRA